MVGHEPIRGTLERDTSVGDTQTRGWVQSQWQHALRENRVHEHRAKWLKNVEHFSQQVYSEQQRGYANHLVQPPCPQARAAGPD